MSTDYFAVAQKFKSKLLIFMAEFLNFDACSNAPGRLNIECGCRGKPATG